MVVPGVRSTKATRDTVDPAVAGPRHNRAARPTDLARQTDVGTFQKLDRFSYVGLRVEGAKLQHDFSYHTPPKLTMPDSLHAPCGDNLYALLSRADLREVTPPALVIESGKPVVAQVNHFGNPSFPG